MLILLCFHINLDIDECSLNLSTCQPDSSCSNTVGSYLCICNDGYFGDGFINCTSMFNSMIHIKVLIISPLFSDINECVNNTHNCDENAQCTDNIGSFSCDCNFGYSGNGTFCCKFEIRAIL